MTLKPAVRVSSSLLLSVFGLLGWQPPGGGLLDQEAPSSPALRIVVLEGEGGVNILEKKTAVQPVVEVRDRSNLPVAGALVTFRLPGLGSGGTFAGGGKTLSVLTNARGQAAMTGFHPAGQGRFSIGVTASHQRQTASAAISQVNSLTGARVGAAGGAIGGEGGGRSRAMIAVIAVAGAAGAVGILKAASRGGGSGGNGGHNPPPGASVSIGPGSGGPAFQPPR